MLWMPPGFAHGFYVVSEAAELLYKCTALYAPAAERTVAWNDPDLAIGWPLVDGEPPVVSAKDAVGTPFARAETVEC
jgi:dTDP-4-dehydrorhamnose 3,5-epimerase